MMMVTKAFLRELMLLKLKKKKIFPCFLNKKKYIKLFS